MSDRASIEINLGFGTPRRVRPESDITQVLVIGSFSNTTAESASSNVQLHRVSADSLDAVLAALAPQVDVECELPLRVRETLCITSIDSFHPDEIFGQLTAFQNLRTIRASLSNPDTARQGLKMLAEIGISAAATESDAASEREPTQAESSQDLFARLLDKSTDENAGPPSNTVSRLIQAAFPDAETQPHRPDVGTQLGALDDATAQLMRAVLNCSAFKRSEAAWRGLHWLVTRLEDDQAEIHIADIDKQQLTDMLAGDGIDALTGMICEPAGASFDLLVSLHDFQHDIEDLLLLAKLGGIAARAGATLIAQGRLESCGCLAPEQIDTPSDWRQTPDDAATFFNELRGHPVAANISLVAPGFLLRHPYGPSSDPVEFLQFEELPPDPEPNAFCWGNPALLAALTECSGAKVRDLPVPIYRDSNGSAYRAPTEVRVGERAAKAIESAGLTPILVNAQNGEAYCRLRRLAMA